MKHYIVSILFLVFCFSCQDKQTEVDVCIYGGTASGVIAAYSVEKMGKSALLIEPSDHLGGMTTGGLAYTDIGNKYTITGLSRLFYRKIGQHYKKFEQWSFPPSVAQKVLDEYIDSSEFPVLKNHRLISAMKSGKRIRYVRLQRIGEEGTPEFITIRAKQFIDCSYEGDLMAAAGISYTVGREDNSIYNETLNGVQLLDKHQFPDSIDPYKEKGNPPSGLCWGISDHPLASKGTGDSSVQAYNYRLCLTNDQQLRRPFEKPETYNPDQYELLLRMLEKKEYKLGEILSINRDMPDKKYDINNNGPFSTDLIGMNHSYIEGSPEERKKIAYEHELYIKGLLYFLANEEKVPAKLRKEASEWGWAKDEFTANDNFPPQLYIREGRRLKGEYVMTQHNCQGNEIVEDGIALAAYGMDSHNCRRIVVNGMVKNEGDVQYHGFPPYPISYRSLFPRYNECQNLLVPVCLSASHIAYGSIRMEPVFMMLGQVAGMAASIAAETGCAIQKVSSKELREKLREDPYLDGSKPDILVDDTDIDKIKYSDNWFKRFGDHYKNSFMFSWAAPNDCFFSFFPVIRESGNYSVYYYCTPMSPEEMSSCISFEITANRNIYTATVNPTEKAGDWALLGSYWLDKDSETQLKLVGERSVGPFFADALLLIPDY